MEREKWSSWMRSEVDLLPIKKREREGKGERGLFKLNVISSCSFNRSSLSLFQLLDQRLSL